MKNLSNKINSRRGSAIELAVVVLLLASLLGTALVSVAVAMQKDKTEATEELTRRTELHMTAEDFIKTLCEGGDIYAWCDGVEEYTADLHVDDTNGGRIVALRFTDADGIIVFTLELCSDDGVSYTVTRWSYK